MEYQELPNLGENKIDLAAKNKRLLLKCRVGTLSMKHCQILSEATLLREVGEDEKYQQHKVMLEAPWDIDTFACRIIRLG